MRERKYYRLSKLSTLVIIAASFLFIIVSIFFPSITAEHKKMFGFLVAPLVLVVGIIDRLWRENKYEEFENIEINDDMITKIRSDMNNIKISKSKERCVADINYGSTTVSGTTDELEIFLDELISEKSKKPTGA